MEGKNSAYLDAALEAQKNSLEKLDRLFDNATPEKVFGEPMTVGDTRVFTASETLATIGFGFGVGGGEGESDEEPAALSDEETKSGGAGGGGGGGGMATGRPVAVVRVDADGVTVEPIVDVTKIGLAAFTALGTMFIMFSKMVKSAK